VTDHENRAAAAIQLKHVAEQIEQWRATRPKGTPIPPQFWRQATQLAAELGVYQVARGLKLSVLSANVRSARRPVEFSRGRPRATS